jgi:quercetin dioxygenase-like cupin family protein
MLVIRHTEIEAVETPGGNHTAGLATPSRGAHEVSVIRQRQLPGGSNPPHYHDREEAIVLLSGTVSALVDGDQAELTPGDTLIVPAQARHQLRNSGGEPAEWLLIAPRGVRFFRPDGEESRPSWAE